MHMIVPPTDTQKNIEAIMRAKERKNSEVDLARRKLSELEAEARGLQIALDTLEGKPTVRGL